MSDHSHPENATIREVQAVKEALINEMKAMEKRLSEKIEAGFSAHDHEHEEMVRRANERHDRIDALLHEEEVDTIRHETRVQVVSAPLRVLRSINEFRVLLLGTGAIIAWLLNGGSITIGG